ncbi:hypothetical protein M513_05816 [Trichuris suis]|uniref:Uncharacterized protein n=1 Tax=Trichuris suis TaxID=68888 RepID=A0A085M7Y9_9BILA|nr:hypothetical protein M513_05816 [Trichuris suis]
MFKRLTAFLYRVKAFMCSWYLCAKGVGPTVLSLCHYEEWSRGSDIETQPASNSFDFPLSLRSTG